ncbi:FGGY-family carbohydrate kinase [Thiolapillus brandeum]|uniref:Carbohydrate kinase n=1 Tax=Thiolapillus brandeum TaxID=1076588 RepID=A0A7U6GI72_9GAMM|nr:FGGY-family carbohydrate kinase [Thiolapillus brandeum]BAO44111.1 conserved hypothetical protein [Thiolapillus brandeum]
MKQPCFIGIDLGTSGCRGICIDDVGRLLASASRPLPPSRHPQDGWSEQHPGDWWSATLEVLQELQVRTPNHQAQALSADGTSGTLVLTNRQGQPLGPGLMYDDRRATAEAELLTRLAPDQAVLHSPSSSLAKLLWLHQHEGLVPGALALHQSEWISGQLCDTGGVGDENNCLKLGYDPVQQCWPTWLNELPLPHSLFPGVLAVGMPLGRISPEITAATGLPSQCQVITGTTDSTAAALAAGLEQPGDALTSLGSTLVCKILVDQPLQSAQYGIYSHRIFGRWLAGGASNSGGAVLRQHFSDPEIRELSRNLNPERSLCLEYYPLPGPGERFPINDPGMPPRLHPVPKDKARFLQGILEGIGRIEVLAYRKLESLGAGYPVRVSTSGGGATNAYWEKLRQRLLKRPVRIAAHPQPAYGAASVARRGAYREG